MEARMEAEFDTMARWTEEVVGRIGPAYALPAACRGSASPAALDWLVQGCDLRTETWLADIGGGIGGPAAYVRDRAGVRPVVLEPMLGACLAASRMFALDAAVAAGERLPMPDATADAAWCLGVLCTTEDKSALLDELHRILVPGGPLGLLVFTADEPRPAGAPAGNDFPSLSGTTRLLDDAGFDVTDTAALTDLPDPPQEWTARVEHFADELTRTYGDDPRFAEAEDQSSRIGRLIETGTVEGQLLLATARVSG